MSDPVTLYTSFYEAPKDIQDLCNKNGGDEDWIAIFPADHPDINNENEVGDCIVSCWMYLRANDMFSVVLPDGRVAVVGTHA